jgi:hypothetical protein
LIVGGVNITKDEPEPKEVVVTGKLGLAHFVFPSLNVIKVVFENGDILFLDASSDAAETRSQK